MKKIKYRVIIIVFALLIVWGISSIGKTIIIKYTGEKVTATVNETPSSCDRYNHITVLLDSVDYEVTISRDDCRQGVYTVGQKVTLLKSAKFKELVWPESQIEIMPLLIIAIFILVYISIKAQH